MQAFAIRTHAVSGALRCLHDSAGWRLCMAERIASELNAERFGVRAVYLFGSTGTGHAGQGSDIDLIVHVEGTRRQCSLLREWFSGWDKALCALNEMITGQETPYVLDVHFVTEKDILDKECFASKINSLYEPATLLRVR